ncbi:MAG: hypothetical protein AAB583_06260 [Patescibacteria group bacterium]
MSKKIKSNNSFQFLLIVFAGLLAILLIAVYFNKSSNNSYNQSQITNNSNGTKMYKSKTLKFTIDLPSKFQVEEKFTTVFMKNINGLISIERIGTNYTDLEGYLRDLESKNRILIANKEELKVNDLHGIRGTITHPISHNIDEKAYFIYVDKWMVFTISTSSPALFGDLDKIAQSFRYTPN